ncbi:MAG TPA: Uma2 family endonuclease [Chloroflexota bacterium]|jgi:Uma2 family endonuclease|nr:Uma2 family endonuclease [Chloroflexota bacterium]
MTTEAAAPLGPQTVAFGTEQEERPLATLRHGIVTTALAVRLAQYVGQHRLGVVLPPQNTYHLPIPQGSPVGGATAARSPEREPDLSFVARDRVPADTDIEPHFAPDLAVVIISFTDAYGGIHARVQQYLAAGTRLVWVVNSYDESVTIYELNAARPRTLTGTDVLDGGAIVPGFQVPVWQLWATNAS